MRQALFTLSLPVLLMAGSQCLAAEQQAMWEQFANCAAGYTGNWESRQADPDRTPDMANMMLDIAAEYEAAAVAALAASPANGSGAEETVRKYIELNVARFVALDARRELNAFLEACPQTE